jgi:cell division protein FtsL
MKLFQYFLGILIFVIIAISAVVKQIQVYEIGYRQSKAEQQITQTEEDIRIIRNKIAEKRTLEYLKQKAQDFGLQIIPPEEALKPTD